MDTKLNKDLRFGTISIKMKLIANYPEVAIDFFKDKLVLEAKIDPWTNTACYILYYPSFKKIIKEERPHEYFVEFIYKKVTTRNQSDGLHHTKQELVKIELITDKDANCNTNRVID